jgi:RNA polymerase sigma-70 factor (ECF subfamily)
MEETTSVVDYDSSIIDQMRRGDQDALGTFIEQQRGVLSAFIQKRVGAHLRTKIEPDDILQEVGIEAIRALPSAPLNERDPLSWLFQICERKIIDAHRKFFSSQKRDASREATLVAGTRGGGLENLLIASLTTPSQAFSRDQKQIQMLAALDTLPAEQREALRLRYLVGMPSKEIAERLGKTDGAVRVMLSRGLARLQLLLENA